MGERKIRNMEEFAAISGLSRPTVSKYFQDPESVRPSTRSRIELALQEHDFRPNIYAVNQNRRQTKNIGIVVPYLADPFFAEIARAIETQFIETGFRPILLSSHGDREQEIDNLESLRSIRPAGVLLAPLGRKSNRDAVASFCDDVPTVLFDSNVDAIGHAFIGSDNAQSVGMIVRYLCESGQAPAFLEMRTPTNPNALKRRAAYIDAMKSIGEPPRLLQVDGAGWDFEEIGHREGTRLINEGQLPTNTILCSNDRLAIGLLTAAYQCGLRVGRGNGCALRVAGHDDHPFSRYTCPRLTTVAQDYTSIAKTSVQTLLSIIDGDVDGDTRRTSVFPGNLIVRDSA